MKGESVTSQLLVKICNEGSGSALNCSVIKQLDWELPIM